MVTLTEEEYQDYRLHQSGYCYHCNEIIEDAFMEPDAIGYICPNCSRPHLMGMEEALILGKLEVIP